MKKLYLLATLGVLLTGLAGCNMTRLGLLGRGGGCLSGGCFSRNQPVMESYDSYDCCDPCESYYMGGPSDVQWGPGTVVQDLPVPGPESQGGGS